MAKKKAPAPKPVEKKTSDEAVADVAKKYNEESPASPVPFGKAVRNPKKNVYEQDFGTVSGIVERVAKQRRARDERDGIVG